MPIYEFHCESCGHKFEELVFRTSEIEELTCPECGTQAVSRLLSAFSSASSSKSSGSLPSSASCGPGSFT
jgi:putative FmdB family regulatory protein